jgi:hypothetical protein
MKIKTLLTLDEITQITCSYLHSNGWNCFAQPSVALSYLMYDSAVGKKEVQAYLSWDQYNWNLSGNSLCPRSNFLATASVLIPRDSNADELNSLLFKFCQNVEKAIADSYAVRLLRHGVLI